MYDMIETLPPPQARPLPVLAYEAAVLAQGLALLIEAPPTLRRGPFLFLSTRLPLPRH